VGNQLLLYFRHIALAESGKFGRFAWLPASFAVAKANRSCETAGLMRRSYVPDAFCFVPATVRS